jgi:CelD/BcsL family acetyltransferase involved in cellulose biosynthesis
VIELVDDVAGFERLSGEWTALLEASAADCLFLTWEWAYTWWKHLAGSRRLSILSVRSGGELIAIAPFTWCAPRVASLLPLPSLEFLGTGTVGSDYLDIIVRDGRERDALDELRAYLASQRVVLELAQVKKQRSSAAKLADELKPNGWSQCKMTSGVCPFINLTGHSWGSYLGSLGSEHRYNFNRRLKNARKNFNLSFKQAHSPEECRDALGRLIILHNMRWQGYGGSDAFCTPALLQFHDELSRVALDRRWLRLFVLWLDAEPVAAIYGFLYRHVFYFYQSGYNPSYRKHSVGLIAMGLAIESAIEDGAQEYDLLHGDESYKFHWAKEVRELERLELYPSDARALVAKQARAVSRVLRKTARRVLPKMVGDRISATRRLGAWKGLYGAWVH